MFHRDFDPAIHDPRDPDPWLALYLDRSVPMDDDAKAAMLRSMRRRSRRVLLPFMRPLAGLALIVVGAMRAIIPTTLHSSRLLHRLIYWGLRIFVAPEANYMILRHFHIGSEILAFIADNVPGAEVDTVPLRPHGLKDLIDNVFLQHDLNLFNFVIQLNAHLRGHDQAVEAPDRINFDAITDGPFPIEPMPTGALNFIDLQTAVVAYTPLYQLFLTDNDFWRASNSLQLDETIGIYVSQILETPEHLSLINNAHPLLPVVTIIAGFRLMLHGLAAEQLHYHLRLCKRRRMNAGQA